MSDQDTPAAQVERMIRAVGGLTDELTALGRSGPEELELASACKLALMVARLGFVAVQILDVVVGRALSGSTVEFSTGEREDSDVGCDTARNAEALLAWCAGNDIPLDALPPAAADQVANLRLNRLETRFAEEHDA